MTTVTLMDTDMAIWGPGVRHYRTGDGQDLAVEAGGEIADGVAEIVDELLVVVGETFASTTVVLRPTVILPCDADGSPLDDVVPQPLHTSPPGTSHEDALRAAGFDIGGAR